METTTRKKEIMSWTSAVRTSPILVLRNTLARGRRRREERGDDTIGQRREELRDNRPQIERRREDDDILGVEHLFVVS